MLSIQLRIVHLLCLFACALPFVRVALLPVVDAKIQPTELIFLVLGPMALWHYGRSLVPRSRLLRWGLLAYLSTNLLAAAVAANLSAGLEAVGRVYLALLALIVARFVAGAPAERSQRLLDWFLYGTTALAICTYVGYAWALTGELNSMVQVYGNYPYLGTVLRAKGFTAGAGMLIIVLLLPTLYAWWGWRTGRLRIWWFLLLFPLAGLTFAKEVLLLGLGILLVDPLARSFFAGRGRRMQGAVITAVALTFWLGTHFIVQGRQPFEDSELYGTNYTAGTLVWQGGGYQVIQTSYLELKKASLFVAAQHPLLGVGPGQFGRALPAEKIAGRYPASLPDYDPHSTWLGALAETGVLGFAGLCLLAFAFWRAIHQSSGFLPAAVSSPLIVFFLLIFIMSVSKDVMNFRFLWFALGILIANSPVSKQ